MVLKPRSAGMGILAVVARACAFVAPLAFVGCVTFEDRCADVRCGAGEICVDKEPAPECVCDDAHVRDEQGVCVALEGQDDAGPQG